MVKINRIYTRTGDDGTTGLVGGERVPKDHPRVEAYGDVDELNSIVGWARTLAENHKLYDMAPKLERIEHELFDIGAVLATNPKSDMKGIPNIVDEQIRRLEQWIDSAVEGLPELKSFVLPGGNDANSVLHLARAVCRRAERSVLRLSRSEQVPQPVLIYLNRLSDTLFAFARQAAHQIGTGEYLWQPGQK